MTKEKTKQTEEAKIAIGVGTRGRTFEGTVTKKFHKRIVIEFERTEYIQKYERYFRKKTKLHARLLDSMAHEINVGDYVQIMECRPLSKIIHFIVVKKLKNYAENAEASKLLRKQIEVTAKKEEVRKESKAKMVKAESKEAKK